MPQIQIIGGAFQDAFGNPLANGSLTLVLSHDEQEPTDPGQLVGGLALRVPLDGNGNVSGTVNIWPNDVLLPAGSYYIVNAYNANGTQAWKAPQYFTLTSGTNPYNLGNIIPNNPAPAPTTTGVVAKISMYNGIATAGNGVPSEVNQILATGLTANYNSGSAKTIFTPSAATVLRIGYSQAITTAGSLSSTFPSLTLGWTDQGGIARTKTLVSTSSVNTTAVESDGVAVIYTNASTAVKVTSASYASSAAGMTYQLTVTTEIL